MTLNFLRCFYLPQATTALVCYSLYRYSTTTTVMSHDNVYPLLSSQLSFTSQSFQSMHSIVYSTNTKNTKFPWSPVYSMKSFMSAWPEALGDYWVLWELRSQNWSLPTFVATSDQYCWIFPQLVISLYTVFHFNISDNWSYKFIVWGSL